MRRTKPLRLLLGLRLRDPASEAAARAAEAFLNEAASLEPGLRLPLAWNLPLEPLGRGRGRKDLAAEIKNRVRTCGDSVLLMGYVGAPHPLLAAEELDRELSWCRRNPWGPGAKGLLGQEPRHLLPVAADLMRERVDGIYARHGFESVGLAASVDSNAAHPGPKAFRLPASPGRAALYNTWVLSTGVGARSAGRPEALIALAAAAGRQPLFLLLEPEAEGGLLPGGETRPTGRPEPAGLLAALLRALADRFEPHFLTLEEALAEEAPDAPETPGLPSAELLPLICPSTLEASARAEALRARARRKTDADIRAVLETLGGQEPRTRAAARLREAGRATLGEPTVIAAMSGLVSLQGDGIAATFADGRFSGLQRQGMPGGQPADSYLIADGRRLELETESAFSYEQGEDSGLRSVLKTVLAGGEARLVMQACFHEGQEELELGFKFSFPDLPPELRLEAVVPLEFPVFPLTHGERVTVTGELPGGGGFSSTLTAEPGQELFTGARLRLWKAGGGPALVLASGTATGVLVLPVRVAHFRRRLHLLASPFGACFPAPSSLYSGRTLSFTLHLGLEA